MKQLRTILISILFFSCTAEESVEKVEREIKLVSQRDCIQTFDWSAYYFKDGNKKLNPYDVSFDIAGNVEFRFDDTTLWIMPLDTSRILIEVESEIEKTNYAFNATPNHLIDSSWHHVPMGQFPTPLDKNSMQAWINFSQYRILGQQVPRFIHFDYLSSDTLTSRIFQGKTTFLNFWYRGCIPCIAEMPALKKLKEEWEHEKDVQFISVCLDSIYIENDSVFVNSGRIHSTEPIPDYHVKTGFRHIGLGKAIADSFMVRAYPTNLIIDPNGKVAKIHVGANPDTENDELVEKLNKAIQGVRNKERLKNERLTKQTIELK